MSESEPQVVDPVPAQPLELSPWVLIVFGVGFLLLLMVGMFSGMAGFQALFALVFGWLTFLSHGLSLAQPDGPGLAIGVGAIVLMGGLLHAIGRRCSITLQGGNWTWRSTICGTGLFIALFAGGIAVIGATHQLVWLIGGSRTRTLAATSATWPDPPDALNFVGHARRQAQMTQSRSQLKMVGLALHSYHDVYGAFPAGVVLDEEGQARHGWTLPLCGSGMMMFTIDHNWTKEPWDGPQNIPIARGAIPDFVNPILGWEGQFDDRGLALMHYAGNVRVFPVNRSLRISDIRDGTSNTLFVGEVAERFQPWASPWNVRDPEEGINRVPWGFGGPPGHPGAQFLLCDGTVRLISRQIDPAVLKALSTPDGNETVGEDW